MPKNNPSWFHSTILHRTRLNHADSEKNTYHIELCLKGSNINYEVGDCLKILPENSQKRVDGILASLGFSGNEWVEDRENASLPLAQFLKERSNLHRISKKLFQAIVLNSDSRNEEGYPHPLLASDKKEELANFLEQADLLDLLSKMRPTLEAQSFVSLLGPLIPRFYSIASSMKVVGQQAHLTVSAMGVASDFLCFGSETGQTKIKIAHHQSPHFHLAPDTLEKPIIMIGAGTGIAPFRGFLQERQLKSSAPNWLFFGERRANHDFYYSDYLKQLESSGKLLLDCAFSRDGAQKIYVQDLMLQKAHELWRWIQSGAYLFVCGDKVKMAKGVENALLQIFEQQGQMASHEAKQYLTSLRSAHRYLRDVY